MKKLFFAVIIILSFSRCNKSGTSSSCSYDACATVAPTAEINAVQSYLSANSLTATQHCSGLFYSITQPGTGTTPTVCNNVVINYEGRLTNGTVFDQSTSPTNFPLSNLIKGWQNGLPLIKTGGSIILYVPPSLGYGSTAIAAGGGRPGIPANSILIFKIDLLGVQ